jgi:hypothetical protein
MKKTSVFAVTIFCFRAFFERTCLHFVRMIYDVLLNRDTAVKELAILKETFIDTVA